MIAGHEIENGLMRKFLIKKILYLAALTTHLQSYFCRADSSIQFLRSMKTAALTLHISKMNYAVYPFLSVV